MTADDRIFISLSGLKPLLASCACVVVAKWENELDMQQLSQTLSSNA